VQQPADVDKESAPTGVDELILDESLSADEPQVNARKLAKKAAKEEKRAKRAGNASADTRQKLCNVCSTNVNMLIGCRIGETHNYKSNIGCYGFLRVVKIHNNIFIFHSYAPGACS
jgi:hypothetical protein